MPEDQVEEVDLTGDDVLMSPTEGVPVAAEMSDTTNEAPVGDETSRVSR